MESKPPEDGESGDPNVPLFLDDIEPSDGSGDESALTAAPARTPLPPSPLAPDVSLPSGEALRLSAAAAVTIASSARVIAVLGEQDSGKTTLLASLWECFLRGPYEGMLFAGSQTQPAFDRRCFDARVESGRASADTERTELRQDDDQYVLHLAVRGATVLDAHPSKRPPVQHLLFPDRSGEDLREARQSSAVAKTFPLVPRADHIVFLADGKRLADPALRHEAVANVRTLFRRLLEAGMIGGSFVHVVVTKNDLLTRDDVDPGAEAYVESFLSRMTVDFGDVVRELMTYRVAARPEDSAEIAVGIGPLFRRWVDDSPYAERSERPPHIDLQPGDRHAVRWAYRQTAFETAQLPDST